MNYPSGLTSRDWDHIEGRHYDEVEGLNQADRDELRGQDWMRSLPVAEHDAIPLATNAAGTVFQARCGCNWYGRSRYGTFAKAHAQVDANGHNAE